jgi:NADPH-dependent 2,4-dienoyl-CoA reductase/sulfur reductase-like enzyme
METARLASLRGHAVVLAEAAARLGGRFLLAAGTAEPNAALLRWFESEMERRQVEVRLDTRMDADAIEAASFDDVFVATGARWPRPNVPGADLGHVQTVDDLGDWLADAGGAASERGRSFVVVGGNRAGIALAGVARARGAEVEVLEPGVVFAAANGLVGRWRYVHEARAAGISLEPQATLRAIDPRSVHWVDAEGAERSSSADHVIVSSGAVSDTTLVDALVDRGIAARALGDCFSIGLVEGAMQRAAELVLDL